MIAHAPASGQLFARTVPGVSRNEARPVLESAYTVRLCPRASGLLRVRDAELTLFGAWRKWAVPMAGLGTGARNMTVLAALTTADYPFTVTVAGQVSPLNIILPVQ
jgi:hypothetical protein